MLYFSTTHLFPHPLNELNSKSYLLQGGTAIPSDANMDTYTKIGNYYCQSNTTAASLSNAPFTKAFALKVIYANGVQFPCQIYREYDTGRIAVRTSTNPTGANNSWNGYRYFSDDTTLMNTLTAYAPTRPEDNDDISDVDVWTVAVRRFGRLVNIQFNVRGTVKTAGKFITLFTLNEGYRPISSIQHNYISQNGAPMILNINQSDGAVQIYAAKAMDPGDFILRQCITFAAAQ